MLKISGKNSLIITCEDKFSVLNMQILLDLEKVKFKLEKIIVNHGFIRTHTLLFLKIIKKSAPSLVFLYKN